MLPTSTKAPFRFTPEGSETTYLIEVPTSISKAKYRRAMTALGARIWPNFALIESARAAIDLAQPANAEDLIAICDRYEAMTAETPDDEKREIAEAWMELSRVIAGNGGDFAARVADNEFWWELAPLMAARCFLIAPEGLVLKRGHDGLIPEETLTAAVEQAHIGLIGWRALGLFSPSEAEAKNSASPRPSPSDPAISPSASSPQTDPAGSSSESSSSETQS